MLGEGLLLKTTALLVFFLCLVKSLKNLYIIDSFVDHLEKCALFPDFVTVVSDRIAKACNRSGAARAVTLDLSNGFDRV